MMKPFKILAFDKETTTIDDEEIFHRTLIDRAAHLIEPSWTNHQPFLDNTNKLCETNEHAYKKNSLAWECSQKILWGSRVRGQ